jgi:hypothetical protein
MAHSSGIVIMRTPDLGPLQHLVQHTAAVCLAKGTQQLQSRLLGLHPGGVGYLGWIS